MAKQMTLTFCFSLALPDVKIPWFKMCATSTRCFSRPATWPGVGCLYILLGWGWDGAMCAYFCLGAFITPVRPRWLSRASGERRGSAAKVSTSDAESPSVVSFTSSLRCKVCDFPRVSQSNKLFVAGASTRAMCSINYSGSISRCRTVDIMRNVVI